MTRLGIEILLSHDCNEPIKKKMPRFQDILRLAAEKRASDIHFSSEEPIRFRIDGDLVSVTPNSIPSAELESLLFQVLSEEEQKKLQEQKNLDKSCLIPGVGQFRVNIFFNRKGIAAVFRTIPSKTPSLDALGLPEIIKKLCEKPRGLILVTGPTGSGKSTTLAAIIDHLNSNFPFHILTVEDPVEFIHASKKSLVNQREIGTACHSFQDALKYALREDPDVILIGELRDLETISLALTAAETGHLVFGTLHTRGAAPSIDRIIDSFPANQQSMIRAMLADSLLAVISQALLKKADGSGRIAAYEIMVVNNAISNLIREGKVFQIEGVIQTSKKDGMMLMDQSLLPLVTSGQVHIEEAAPYFKSMPTITPKMGFSKPAAAKMPQGSVPVKPLFESGQTVSVPSPLTEQFAPEPAPTGSPPLQNIDEKIGATNQEFFISEELLNESSRIDIPKNQPVVPPIPSPPPLKKKAG